MLHLLFRLGQEHYALPALEIEAVVPMPDLQPLPLAPPQVAGLLRYQGQFVPVIDIGVMQLGQPARHVISTRLILVRRGQGEATERLALVVEQALDMLPLYRPQTLPTDVLGEQADWLSPVVYETDVGLVRAVHWQTLLTPALLALASTDAA